MLGVGASLRELKELQFRDTRKRPKKVALKSTGEERM
jgi:hypothetical protein